MLYVSEESYSKVVGSVRDEHLVILDTDNKDYRLETKGINLREELYDIAGFYDMAGMYDAEFSHYMIVAPVSPIEVQLLKFLKYRGVDNTAQSARYLMNPLRDRSHWFYEWYIGCAVSIAYILYDSIKANMKVICQAVRVTEETVEVYIGSQYGRAMVVVYDILDWRGFCSAISKYQLLRPKLKIATRFEVSV